jgi:hypothetical protein
MNRSSYHQRFIINTRASINITQLISTVKHEFIGCAGNTAAVIPPAAAADTSNQFTTTTESKNGASMCLIATHLEYVAYVAADEYAMCNSGTRSSLSTCSQSPRTQDRNTVCVAHQMLTNKRQQLLLDD